MTKAMNGNGKTIASLADALEVLSGVLRELATTPIPPSAEAASVGMNNFVPVDEFGSAKDCAERFHYSVSGITPYLVEGVRLGKITKMTPMNSQRGRKGEARFNMREVRDFLSNQSKS
ncbi:hypothetical protein [Akkermansia massiliensis]